MVEFLKLKQLWTTKINLCRLVNVFLLNLYRKLCYCYRKPIFLQNIILSPNYRPPSHCFSCIRTSRISELGECLQRGSDKRGSSVHSKQQHKYSTFFCSTFASHTHIYLYLSSPSINPPPTSPTEAIHFFSTCFLCALKGSWGGGSFCIEILSMISQKRIGEKKKGRSHSFPLSWRYIKCCTRETVYEKVFFCFRHLILWKKSGVYIWPIYIVYVSK